MKCLDFIFSLMACYNSLRNHLSQLTIVSVSSVFYQVHIIAVHFCMLDKMQVTLIKTFLLTSHNAYVLASLFTKNCEESLA